MNVGVIGAGLMGSTHARLLARAIPGATVAAIADPVAPAGEFATYADGLELIADPAVDAVVVASPAATHEPYVLACLGRASPCCARSRWRPRPPPRCGSSRPERGRGLVTVGFMRRFDPGYVDLKARLDAGKIGAPLLMHCAHRNVSVHEFFDSAMILTDSAVHEVDVARWLLDDEIARVTVFAPRRRAAASATRSCCCSRRQAGGSSTSRSS